jgi:hypothetical protein
MCIPHDHLLGISIDLYRQGTVLGVLDDTCTQHVAVVQYHVCCKSESGKVTSQEKERVEIEIEMRWT